ncbi:MAG: metallophosphoesterase family protein [Actinomycetes bacterium]
MGLRIRTLASVCVVVGVTAPAALASPAADRVAAVAAEEPRAVYVSTSGVPHWDIADVKSIRAGRGWHTGDPNSITSSWRSSLNTVMAQIASENPDAVFHTGDQVQGRWGVDVDHTGIFGHVGTEAEKKDAVLAAGNAYYGEMKRFWSAHGFTHGTNLFPAMGDHEIGDMGPGVDHVKVLPPSDFRYRAFNDWKYAWARNYTASGTKYASRPVGAQQESTAYSVRLGPLLLITVNPFWKWDDGIHARIGGAQLDWLDQQIATARANGVDHVLVQSEIPVLDPNRVSGSSELLLEGRRDSAFWKTLVRDQVDVLLAAEFHDMTTYSNSATTPVQVVHGANMGSARANYLVIRVYADRLELELKQMSGTVTDTNRLWQTSTQRPPRGVRMNTGATTVGTMTIDKTTNPPTLANRTGFLREGIE